MKTIEQDDVPATQQYRDSELQATQQGSDKENKKSKKNKNTITCATLEAYVFQLVLIKITFFFQFCGTNTGKYIEYNQRIG